MISRPLIGLIAAVAIAGCSGTPASQTAFAPTTNDVRSVSGTPAQLAARGLAVLPRPVVANQSHLRSWMSPDAKKQSQLLYVSDETSDAVDVYSYPQGKLQGTLTGFNAPAGICSDTAGNVYITNGNDQVIDVYAHGGSSPIGTLDLPGYPQLNCVVDPQSGNLALGVITNSANEIAVFAKAKGTPTTYNPPNQNGFPGCAYDAHGNLFCDAYGSTDQFALYELPRKDSNVQYINVSGTTGIDAGPMQWDGKKLTFSKGASGTIYQIDQSASGDSIGAALVLAGTGDVWQYWIAGNRLIAPTYGGSLGAVAAIFKYPAGGSAIKSIAGASQPDGAAISTLKK
jgi:hypothetical protein